jgi:hypothetical protein
MDDNIKNLLKNPASGGIPAIEKRIIVNAKAKTLLFSPAAVQFTKYLG